AGLTIPVVRGGLSMIIDDECATCRDYDTEISHQMPSIRPGPGALPEEVCPNGQASGRRLSAGGCCRVGADRPDARNLRATPPGPAGPAPPSSRTRAAAPPHRAPSRSVPGPPPAPA